MDKGRKIYKTMQGKTVDMDLLRQRNELTPAVGNVKVNARGDELGSGGKIVKKREELVNEYYKNQRPAPDEIPVKRNTAQAVESKEEEWIEDEDGNFVRKENE
mgnify:CR=1 FL=1